MARPALDPAGNRPGILMAAPALLLIVLVIVLPQLLLLRMSLNQYSPTEIMISALTLENYAKAVTDPFYIEVLSRTFAVSGASVVISLILGLPLAYTTSRTRSQRWKSMLFVIVIVPLLIGNAARTIGWMVLLSDGGAINSALQGIGLIEN